MRILYGVNGEGMGHATRSRVVIDSLLAEHDVRVVASGAAFAYLKDRLPRVDEVLVPSFAMEEGEIHRWATVVQNVRNAGKGIPDTVHNWVHMVDETWRPEVVITDFEPLTGVYARTTRTPMIAVDNVNMLDRCHHDAEIIGPERQDFTLARAVVRSMVPGAGGVPDGTSRAMRVFVFRLMMLTETLTSLLTYARRPPWESSRMTTPLGMLPTWKRVSAVGPPPPHTSWFPPRLIPQIRLPSAVASWPEIGTLPASCSSISSRAPSQSSVRPLSA